MITRFPMVVASAFTGLLSFPARTRHLGAVAPHHSCVSRGASIQASPGWETALLSL